MLKRRTWNTTTQAVALETRAHPTSLRRAILPLLVLLLCGWLPLNASASLIEFHLSANYYGGTFEYDIPGGPLTAVDLQVDEVVGTQTPLNPNGVLACSNCMLNFTTGDLISYSATGNKTWLFGGTGSSIEIAGLVPTIGINTQETLVTADFTDPVTVIQIGGAYTISFANHNNELNSTIATYYGVDPISAEPGGLNVISIAPTASGGTFSTNTILSGDVTLTLQPIPEPGTAFLLAIGLAGLATQTSRQQRLRQ